MLYGFIAGATLREGVQVTPIINTLIYVTMGVAGELMLLLVLAYSRRGFRNVKFERRYFEGGFRLLFSCLMLATFSFWAIYPGL